MTRLFFSGLMALCMLPATANAQSMTGEELKKLDAIRGAYIQQWLKTPLTIRNATYVSRKNAGFGKYTPRANNIFKSGEDMLVYAEPVGYGWGRTSTGYSIDFSVDFTISTAAGKVLAGRKAFQKLGLKSRVQNTEFFISLTYTFTGIPVGEYVVTTTLNGSHTGKTVSFDLPFTIVK